jgi:hypothetical protein
MPTYAILTYLQECGGLRGEPLLESSSAPPVESSQGEDSPVSDDADDDDKDKNKETESFPTKAISKKPPSQSLGDSVQTGLSLVAEAMVEVAKISAAKVSAGTLEAGRIEKLLEQQSESFRKQALVNVKLLEALERLASK